MIKILLLDNYDSFTYNLYDYFLQTGAICQVIRNDEKSLAEIEMLDFDAIVLSPGPKKPENAGCMMDLIKKYHNKVPILGICLGHQALGLFFGAQLVKSPEPVHGKTSSILHLEHPIFEHIPTKFVAMRYHSLLLKDLENTPLQIIGETETGENMALAHPNLPIVGIQFHPESILTDYGHQIIENWVKIIKKHTFVSKIEP